MKLDTKLLDTGNTQVDNGFKKFVKMSIMACIVLALIAALFIMANFTTGVVVEESAPARTAVVETVKDLLPGGEDAAADSAIDGALKPEQDVPATPES